GPAHRGDLLRRERAGEPGQGARRLLPRARRRGRVGVPRRKRGRALHAPQADPRSRDRRRQALSARRARPLPPGTTSHRRSGVSAGRELVLVAGNHDHALLGPWLSRRGELDAPAPLELEQLISPSLASPMVERIAEWASPARVQAAYPGLWVRADVYAIHGHYLDCHFTVPTIERLSVGVMARLLGRHPESFQSVEDYEAVTAPMYAWRHAIARVARTTGP